MMPPSLLYLRIGVVPLPLPVFLLWPVAWLVWLAVWAAALATGRSPRRRPHLGPVLAVLSLLAGSRGLRVDIAPQQGPSIHVNLL